MARVVYEGAAVMYDGNRCLACDAIESAFPLTDCGHYWCPDCLRQLVETSLSGMSRFPPTCCIDQHINPLEIRAVLGRDMLDAWELAAIKSCYPNSMVCYCRECQRFLLPSTYDMDADAICPRCTTKTCTRCKEYAHDGPCSTEGNEQLKKLAEEMGWAQCPGCEAMVELSKGCYHMTCTCGQQFCYLCSAKWKTCSCSQFGPEFGRDHDPEEDAEIMRQLALDAMAMEDRPDGLAAWNRLWDPEPAPAARAARNNAANRRDPLAAWDRLWDPEPAPAARPAQNNAADGHDPDDEDCERAIALHRAQDNDGADDEADHGYEADNESADEDEAPLQIPLPVPIDEEEDPVEEEEGGNAVGAPGLLPNMACNHSGEWTWLPEMSECDICNRHPAITFFVFECDDCGLHCCRTCRQEHGIGLVRR